MAKTRSNAAQRKMIEVFNQWRRDKANVPDPMQMMVEIKKHLKLLGAKQSTVDAIPAQPTSSPQDSQRRLLIYWDLVHNEARFYGATNYVDTDAHFWPGLLRNIGRVLEAFDRVRRGLRTYAEAKPVDIEQAVRAMEVRYKAEVEELFEGGATVSRLLVSEMAVMTFTNTLGQREKITPVVAAKGRGKAASAGVQ